MIFVENLARARKWSSSYTTASLLDCKSLAHLLTLGFTWLCRLDIEGGGSKIVHFARIKCLVL